LIEVRVDKEIRADAFTWLQPRAHLWRDIKEDDRHIAFTEDGQIKACLLFSDFDDPRACQKRYIKLMFDYAFNQCNSNRMTAMCVNGYTRNERLLKGVGFIKEGVIRESMKVNNNYVDAAIYGILKGECKWV
jgi:RimJ/RimL family protein N-acetyltransferase